MKTKKAIITVLTAALITALMIGCFAPFDSANNGADGDQPASEAKTMVRLSFADSSARTLLPTTTGKTQASNFAWFKLKITNKAGDVDASPTPPTDATHWTYVELTATTNVISLAAGNYKFEVYATDNKTVNLAYGFVDNKNISGTDDTVSITLKEIINNTDPGTFAWNLDVTTNGYTFATLNLAPIGDPDNPIRTVDLTSTNAGNDATVPSGYYRIVTELRKANCQTVFVRETVHIYAGFTSTYNATLPVLKSTVRVVNYNYGTDNPAGGRTTTENLTLGDVILTAITNKNPAHSSPASYDFDAWYYDSTTTTEKVGATDKIIETPITLYAKWKDKVTPYSLSLVWSGTKYSVANNGSSAVYNIADGTFDISLKVTITGGSPGTISWHVDHSGTVLGTGNDFTDQYDTDNIGWWILGPFTITVYVDDEQGTFTLTPIPDPGP
jgi:uncharacterized repeat protein (TIGR02543 family)